MSKIFSGISCVMFTYLTEQGNIDKSALQAMTEAQIQAGVNNIMVLGSAGEWAYLTQEEKKQVIQAVVGASKGRVPIIAGTSSCSTDIAIENGKIANDLGCDGTINILPMNLALTQKDIYRHYEKLAAVTELPILYYHYPDCTHYDLTPEQYADILTIDGIVGTKNSKLDMKYFRKVMGVLNARKISKTILTGNAFSLVDTMKAGGDGAMCIHVSHWPEKIVETYKNIVAGRHKEAEKTQTEFTGLLGLHGVPEMSAKGYRKLWKIVTSGYLNRLTKPTQCNNGMYKDVVRQLGHPVLPVVKDPLPQVSDKQREAATRVLTKAGLL